MWNSFIGFSFFQSNNSIQGMQNVIFSIFMLTSILSSLVQQVSLPNTLKSCITDVSLDYASLRFAKIAL
jgi:hypothetical protein